MQDVDLHFYTYIENNWAILFSHPCDFTPVCTTEIANLADNQDEFIRRDTRLIGLSVGSLKDHMAWISDIVEEGVAIQEIKFPIIADIDGEVAQVYDMLDREERHYVNERITNCRPTLHTIRSVFIIDDKKKIRAIMSYPMETGRNIEEIIRVLDSLQAHDDFQAHPEASTRMEIVTPANWKAGEDVIDTEPDEDEQAKGRRIKKKAGVEVKFNMPYMKFRSLPKHLLRGYRQERPVLEIGMSTPTGQERDLLLL